MLQQVQMLIVGGGDGCCCRRSILLHAKEPRSEGPCPEGKSGINTHHCPPVPNCWQLFAAHLNDNNATAATLSWLSHAVMACYLLLYAYGCHHAATSQRQLTQCAISYRIAVQQCLPSCYALHAATGNRSCGCDSLQQPLMSTQPPAMTAVAAILCICYQYLVASCKLQQAWC